MGMQNKETLINVIYMGSVFHICKDYLNMIPILITCLTSAYIDALFLVVLANPHCNLPSSSKWRKITPPRIISMSWLALMALHITLYIH